MTALTPQRLEVQLGVDFVIFSRKQAEELRDAVQRFIDFALPPIEPNRDTVEEVVEVEEKVEEERILVNAPPRKKRSR